MTEIFQNQNQNIKTKQIPGRRGNISEMNKARRLNKEKKAIIRALKTNNQNPEKNKRNYMSCLEKAIAAAIKEFPGLNTTQISRIFGTSRSNIEYHADILVAMGKIISKVHEPFVKIGVGKKDKCNYYFSPEFNIKNENSETTGIWERIEIMQRSEDFPPEIFINEKTSKNNLKDKEIKFLNNNQKKMMRMIEGVPALKITELAKLFDCSQLYHKRDYKALLEAGLIITVDYKNLTSIGNIGNKRSKYLFSFRFFEEGDTPEVITEKILTAIKKRKAKNNGIIL